MTSFEVMWKGFIPCRWDNGLVDGDWMAGNSNSMLLIWKNGIGIYWKLDILNNISWQTIRNGVCNPGTKRLLLSLKDISIPNNEE